ncbi:hypothetical protein LTR78_000679 [Recurvomyces mirabilis]|uniref:Uncharacterized protein n=1 Tax=Recurvomyces mirabilis TaxID=574656 RepID=A0AAE1C6T8_9PEZI|nr:hypothetical protein LTR78_000679 [Recurvomyces mirabilis]KAK5162333.1 hypothetical protein LTS14_000680 [Recurvomyces mirabilis]
MASPRNNLLPQGVSQATRSTATLCTPPPALATPQVVVPEFDSLTEAREWFDAFERDAAKWRRQQEVQTSKHRGTEAGFGETAAIQQHDLRSPSESLAERVTPAAFIASTETFTQTSTEATAPIVDRLPTPVTLTGYNVDNTQSRVRWVEDRRSEGERRAAEIRAEFARGKQEAAERCRLRLEEAERRRQQREAFELAEKARRDAECEAQRPRIDRMLDEAIVEAEQRARELRREREREQMMDIAVAKTKAVVRHAMETAEREIAAEQQAKESEELAARVESWQADHPAWIRPNKPKFVMPIRPEIVLRRCGEIERAEEIERKREAGKGKAFPFARPRNRTSQPLASSSPAQEASPLPRYPVQRQQVLEEAPPPPPPVTVLEPSTQYPGRRQWGHRAKPFRERLAQMKLNENIAFRSEPTLPSTEAASDAVNAVEEAGDANVEELSDVIDDTRHFVEWEQRFEQAVAL